MVYHTNIEEKLKEIVTILVLFQTLLLFIFVDCQLSMDCGLTTNGEEEEQQQQNNIHLVIGYVTSCLKFNNTRIHYRYRYC